MPRPKPMGEEWVRLADGDRVERATNDVVHDPVPVRNLEVDPAEPTEVDPVEEVARDAVSVAVAHQPDRRLIGHVDPVVQDSRVIHIVEPDSPVRVEDVVSVDRHPRGVVDLECGGAGAPDHLVVDHPDLVVPRQVEALLETSVSDHAARGVGEADPPTLDVADDVVIAVDDAHRIEESVQLAALAAALHGDPIVSGHVVDSGDPRPLDRVPVEVHRHPVGCDHQSRAVTAGQISVEGHISCDMRAAVGLRGGGRRSGRKPGADGGDRPERKTISRLPEPGAQNSLLPDVH